MYDDTSGGGGSVEERSSTSAQTPGPGAWRTRTKHVCVCELTHETRGGGQKRDAVNKAGENVTSVGYRSFRDGYIL